MPLGTPVLQHVQSTYLRAPDLKRLLPGKPAWNYLSLNPRRCGSMLAVDGRETWIVHNFLYRGETDFDAVDRDAASSIRAARLDDDLHPHRDGVGEHHRLRLGWGCPSTFPVPATGCQPGPLVPAERAAGQVLRTGHPHNVGSMRRAGGTRLRRRSLWGAVVFALRASRGT